MTIGILNTVFDTRRSCVGCDRLGAIKLLLLACTLSSAEAAPALFSLTLPLLIHGAPLCTPALHPCPTALVAGLGPDPLPPPGVTRQA